MLDQAAGHRTVNRPISQAMRPRFFFLRFFWELREFWDFLGMPKPCLSAPNLCFSSCQASLSAPKPCLWFFGDFGWILGFFWCFFGNYFVFFDFRKKSPAIWHYLWLSVIFLSSLRAGLARLPVQCYYYIVLALPDPSCTCNI